MSIAPINDPTSAAKAPSASIAADFDAFLHLLTTQLANQDPLSPMDSNQFTEQLVQFASVEQSVNTNEKLDEMLSILSATRLTTGAEYLGREVLANGDSMVLGKTGATSFTMRTEEKPAYVHVTIYDDANRQVATLEPTPKAGEQEVIWSGRGDDGMRRPAGSYRAVIEAFDATGAPVATDTGYGGIVTAVESNGSDLYLQVGDRRVALSEIQAVRVPAPTTEDEGVSS